MSKKTANISFVLVRPEFLGNIGAVARAMKNFGLTDLRLVEPPKNFKDAEARKMAVGAFDILKGAKVFPSLKEALQDLNYVVGTSSGKQRKQLFVTFDDVVLRLEKNDSPLSTGIVFGDEKNGLSSDELDTCHAVLRIATDPQYPVLNLAQAACIVAYRLSIAVLTDSPASGEIESAPSMKELDQLFVQVKEILQASGFARQRNEGQVMLELQNFFQRALPTRREFDLLNGALKTIQKRLKPTD